MMRDEAWERRAVIDHAQQLMELLRKGQDLDAPIDGIDGTLRSWLISLLGEVNSAIGE
jgi:hypothetical protein